MTQINVTSYTRQNDTVVDDAYRLAVHTAGASRHGKYTDGYGITAAPVTVTTPDTERTLALSALISELVRHGDQVESLSVSWKHETKDGNTVYPRIYFSS